MSIDIGDDDELPITHTMANGWRHFAETILPVIGGTDHAEAHIAFYVGAMTALHIGRLVLAERSSEEASFALDMLNQEVEQFMTAHAVKMQ